MNQKTDFSNLYFKRITHPNDSHEKENKTYSDVENLDQIDSFPGFLPFLRDSSPIGNILSPWNINQNCNSFYQDKENYNFCEDKIESINQMISLLENIPLNEIFTRIKINKNTLIHFAYFIIAAEKKGIKKEELSGTFVHQTSDINNPNTILSTRIVSDIIKYTTKNIPNFKTISIIDQDDTSKSIIEQLSQLFIAGYQIIIKGIERDLKIDTIAPLLHFSFCINNNFAKEISKLRAARMIWAKLIQEFSPQNYSSYQLNMDSFISKTQEDLYSITSQSLSSVLGGTKSLNTNFIGTDRNSFIENIPHTSRNIQLILQEETQICRTIDPLGGSFFIESLTNEISIKTYQKIKEKYLSYQSQTFPNNKTTAINSDNCLEKLQNAVNKNDGNLLELTINAIKNNATYSEINSILNQIIE